MGFFVRVLVNAFAIWIVTLLPALGVVLVPFAPGEWFQVALTLLVVGAIFAIVNSVIGTIVKVLAIPLYILTLGLISFVINGFLLWLTAWITGFWNWGLRVDGFWLTVLAALVIGIINWIAGLILRPRPRERRD
ncbi:phage holin family protein [Microbacterium hatanonis]|jgi:putative membrane protein|uniref:Phage holin family protein n=1 Tax=Microbacterium hatanonis TaxID=404366 RepID=A0A5C8HW83_9MICO|nr:phage holin family protein [Microbacterium hatanonis]TXK09640.1 phage holin family protein [Microbacterium hatanonis]